MLSLKNRCFQSIRLIFFSLLKTIVYLSNSVLDILMQIHCEILSFNLRALFINFISCMIAKYHLLNHRSIYFNAYFLKIFSIFKPKIYHNGTSKRINALETNPLTLFTILFKRQRRQKKNNKKFQSDCYFFILYLGTYQKIYDAIQYCVILSSQLAEFKCIFLLMIKRYRNKILSFSSFQRA